MVCPLRSAVSTSITARSFRTLAAMSPALLPQMTSATASMPTRRLHSVTGMTLQPSAAWATPFKIAWLSHSPSGTTHTANRLWLDSSYPLDKDPSVPRSRTLTLPNFLWQARQFSGTSVTYANIKSGNIGSTYSTTGGGGTTTPRTPQLTANTRAKLMVPMWAKWLHRPHFLFSATLLINVSI